MLRRVLLVVALVTINQVGLPGASAAPSAGGAGAQVDRPLQEIARVNPAQTVRVILQARHPVEAQVATQHANGVVRAYLPQVAGLVTEVRAGQIDTLAREPGVTRVALDARMHGVGRQDTLTAPASVFAQTVGATDLWQAGQTGRGVSIAVLDSGVRSHPDLGTPSRIVAAERFNQGASSAADQYGHGTWVAGIAAGNGASSSGRYQGVAPQASIVNLKVSDDAGLAYTSDVIQALGWVLANHTAMNIRVVNLSFVSTLAEGYATSVLDAAVEMVWHAGVVVVVSAGNRGANSEVYAPANDPYVITVGASDDLGTASAADDVLAWFSSFGVTQAGHFKPDLVAPGRHVIGPLSNSGAALAQEYPAKVIDPHYIQLSGTSAASPVVAGAISLLLQNRPTLTPDQIKWLLTSTTRQLSGTPLGSGAGQLDVAAAWRFNGALARANTGLTPNLLVALAYLRQTGQSSVSWDSVSWDSVSWDSVSWDSVSWDSVSWDSVSWDSVSWDSVSWDSVLGND